MLFTVAKTWKQPRCLSTDERIQKLWFIYTMEYYSPIRSNTFESVLRRWMNPEPITHSKVSQKEKNKYHTLRHIIWNLDRQHWWTYLQGSSGDADTENRLMDTGAGGGRRGWDGWREPHGPTHTAICKTQTVNGNFLYMTRGTQTGALWQPKGGGLGWGVGSQGRGHTYIPMADSCWCMAEDNTVS